MRVRHIEMIVMTERILIFPAMAFGWCALFMPIHLDAQPAQATEKFQRLASDLALTPRQKRQLIPILVSEAPKVEAIKADSSLSRIQKLQKLKAAHDRTDPQIKAILNPEQYQKLQEIRREELEQAIKKRLNH
jgi:periplasmic protein CpxP/Spy